VACSAIAILILRIGYDRELPTLICVMTPKSILEQLDLAASEFTFPMMDNGYVYPADVRMTVYRDTTRWLMNIEILGSGWPRKGGYHSFQNCLHLFGNAIHRKYGTANEDFLDVIENLPDDPLFDEQYDWCVRPQTAAVKIRGNRVPIDLSLEALELAGIHLMEPPNIDPPAVLRSLLPQHRELLLATDQELEARNVHRLPQWLRLNEWFHPDLASNELPSKCETFQMLAEAISTGRKNVYRPEKAPNTKWQNWPEGGTL
jgi:hypothetical protein